MVFLDFYASTVNISYGFLRSIKTMYMWLEFFLICHDENFYFIFLMQELKSKYAKTK